MEIVHHLGTALGLAGLAGINLYLTVLVAGLAIRFHWITLAPQYAQFEILAHPALLGIAGVLFLLQFFADKIPWLDSLWDALQTFIRPIGGACLAVLAMGHSHHPVFNIAVALIGGGIALTSHAAKSGTRLAVNTSPEPFSNIFLSFAEDAGVIGTLILIYLKPTLALALGLVLLLIFLFLMPRFLARTRITLWLVKNKLNAPAWKAEENILPAWLPSPAHQQIERICIISPSEVAWALPCATRASSQLPSDVRGWLVALAPSNSPLYFVGKKGWHWVNWLIPVENLVVQVEHRFLSECLAFSSPDQKNKQHAFIFPRSFTHEVLLAKEDIQRRIQFSSPNLLN